MKTIVTDSRIADFHGVPAHYRKGSKPTWHQRRRQATVARLLRQVPAGDVLDFGCGYGDIAYVGSQTNARSVQGVDVDPIRVQFAAQEYAPIPFTVCPTSGPLDFPDASFDVVMSVVVIHFVPDATAYLREARRVLRPGGHLLLVLSRNSAVGMLLRRIFHLKPPTVPTWIGPGEEPRFMWMMERDELVRKLADEGFTFVAEDGFYDPPTQMSINLKDMVQRIPEQLLSLFGVLRTANYFALLMRKI